MQRRRNQSKIVRNTIIRETANMHVNKHYKTETRNSLSLFTIKSRSETNN